MKKLLLLMYALLAVGVSGAWAKTGSVTLTSSTIEYLRVYNNAFNTKDNATRLASTTSPLVSVNNGGGNIRRSDFGLYTGAYTLQMLSSYTIDSYVITVTPSANQTFSVSGGTASETSLTASTQYTITVSGVNANSAQFTFTANGGSGYNVVSSIVVNYSYTTEPTMVQTMADLNCADYSSCPTYTLTAQRSALYVAENGTSLTTAHAVTTPDEAHKKFAFIKNVSSGNYYLYNVAEQKFVKSDKSLSVTPVDAVKLSFTHNFSYPQYVIIGSNVVNIQTSGTSSGGVVLDAHAGPDGGNCLIVEPTGASNLTKAYKIVNGWTATYHIDGTSFTATADLTYNATLALPNTLKRAYCTYKFYSDAECTNEITTANDVYDDIYVKYNYTGPFAFSTEGVSPEYVYYLLRTYGDNYLYSNGSSIGITTTQNTADAYQWAIVGNPYSYTIKNKGTGTYLVASLSPNGEATLGATGTSFGLYTNTQAPVTNHFTAVTTNDDNLVIPQRHPNAGSGIRCYNGTGAKFTDVTGLNNLAGAYFIPFAVVTYNLIWNESTIQSTTKGSIIGTASEDEKPWAVPAYSSFAYNVATIGKTTTAVNVTLNWDGPFTISSDFNTATWYYMTNNNIHYLYHSSEGVDGYTVLVTDDNLSGAGINAMWAFVGNPYGGIRVINLGAGSGKYLNLNTKAEMVETTYPVYSLCDIIEGTNFFKLKNGDFYLINNYNLGLVSDNRDEWYNSTWAQYQVSAVDFKTLALDFIDDYANDHALGRYFGVARSTYNAVRAMYEDAPSVSASDYTTLITYIGSYLPASYPETGYYRIKSNSGRYIGYGQPEADPMPSVGLRTVSAEDAAKDASTVIRLVKGVGSHQYTMITEGLNVQSMVTGNTPFPATSGAGAVFTLAALSETPGKGTIRDPESNDTDDSDENYKYRNGYLHEADWTVPGVVNWDAGAASSQWEIEDATDLTITLNSVGGKSYATFSAPFPVTIGDGAKAYIIETLDLENNRAIYSEIASKQIPAGAGILLISETAASSVTATVSGTDFDELTGNLLVGYNLAPAFSYPDETTNWNLVLGNSPTTGIGFYKMNGTATPNKAYLPCPHTAGAGVKSFRLVSADDLETGIEDIKAKQQNEAVYDLSGRRVINPKRGLYITKGHKFVR